MIDCLVKHLCYRRAKPDQRRNLLVQLLKLSCVWILLFLSPLAGSQPTAETETPEVIVVVGRQPGPPLWRVYKGDNVLWIFPYLSPVPKDMIWESDKVATVIADAQEVLELPNQRVGASPLLLLNPVNIFRGMRLMKRLSRNPDGATLAQSVPADLFARFAALQAKYFPDQDDFEELRPVVAGGRMTALIQRQEQLVRGDKILATIRRLIRRNRHIERTKIEVKMELEGGYQQIADRMETLTESLDHAHELACFEGLITHMERDLEPMKQRANAWARGHINEFRDIPLQGDSEGACKALMMNSSEQETLTDLGNHMEAQWLDAAEKALATNRTTFAILPINSLLTDDGLLGKLKAKGYQVREP